jgi:large subunit ribosomal protein L2
MSLKTYRPITPGQRGTVLVDRSGLWKGRPERSLTESLSRSGGRNARGRVTAYQRGGGHKRLYRNIDFKRSVRGTPGRVERFEYDPNRTAHLALLRYEDGQVRYILAPAKLSVGDKVIASLHAENACSFPRALKIDTHRANLKHFFSRALKIQPSNPPDA